MAVRHERVQNKQSLEKKYPDPHYDAEYAVRHERVQIKQSPVGPTGFANVGQKIKFNFILRPLI
jgi:hypothetical protein